MIWKRLADWMEKISAGALLIGLFQSKNIAVFLGVWALVISILLTIKLGRGEK